MKSIFLSAIFLFSFNDLVNAQPSAKVTASITPSSNAVCSAKDICLEISNIPDAILSTMKQNCASDIKGIFKKGAICPSEDNVGFCAPKDISHKEAKAIVDEKYPRGQTDLSEKNRKVLADLKKSDADGMTTMGITFHFYSPAYSMEQAKAFCEKKDLMYVAP